MDKTLNHIAFILDGNRRWAKENNLPSLMGHKRGYERAKDITLLLSKYDIKYVTYYMFSTENWNRSAEEVSYLMNLFRDFFSVSDRFFNKNNIRIKAIGNFERLPDDICNNIKKLEQETENNTGLTVIPAISYSSRDEIVRAAKKIAIDTLHESINVIDLTEDIFSSYLDTAGIPDPEVLVRTSEQRISNFLLWQIAYTEVFFIDKYWPDFSEDDLKNVLEEFSNRNRRYGR